MDPKMVPVWLKKRAGRPFEFGDVFGPLGGLFGLRFGVGFGSRLDSWSGSVFGLFPVVAHLARRPFGGNDVHLAANDVHLAQQRPFGGQRRPFGETPTPNKLC